VSRFISAIFISGLIGWLSGCAERGDRACSPELGRPMSVFTLYFGKAIPGRGDLTEAEWRFFLNDTVTTSLPGGYTVLDAYGAWLNPKTQTTGTEATKVVVVALPEAHESVARIDRVRTMYQDRFHQQLVGMTVEKACASF
jgi:hypothetical protein